MNDYRFSISNFRTRKFIVQCPANEDFFGFMFGISHRCKENNLWFTIEDEKLSLEFKSRAGPIAGALVLHWLARNYDENDPILKSFFRIETSEHGIQTCMMKDIKSFINGWVASETIIEHLKPAKLDLDMRICVFKRDPITAQSVTMIMYDGDIDTVLTETTIFVQKNTTLGKTNCCLIEVIK